MIKKKDKSEVKKEIIEFFGSGDFTEKKPSEIKKIKKMAMSINFKLGHLRKRFCQGCYSNKLRTKKIKRGFKTIECIGCGRTMRWKTRPS